MLKNITRSLSLSLLVFNSAFASIPLNSPGFNAQFTTDMLEKYGAEFTSLEHQNMGDLVFLHLPGSMAGEKLKLSLPNGLKLSYGEIVMFAGDMFGDPSKPISNCAAKDRMACFKAQFTAMALQGKAADKRCSNPLNQAKTIQEFMATIAKQIESSREQGISASEYYRKNDVDISKQMNELTCGGSFISSYIPFGTYIKLAQVNFDHFVPDSLLAYKVGHRYAMETALEGYKKEQAGLHEEAMQLLELAYAQNAYANHYLSDSFSAGHMRTPRRAIDQEIYLPAVLNLLIANLMHNEDNKNGLNVVNAEGTSWIAYGDGYLDNPEAQAQKVIMLDAMQRSADGIYLTFQNGEIPETYPEMRLLPDYAAIPQLNNSAPLFKYEDGVLLKRSNNSDPNDHHWSSYWSGIITLIRFSS
ncbi:MAG: phospholipase [Legionella sp.]|nr:MAG: phospholipase [Legionella sp.]